LLFSNTAGSKIDPLSQTRDIQYAIDRVEEAAKRVDASPPA